jgi:hypothetical protein
LEVVLRNKVHDTLTAHAGTEWWFKSVSNGPMFENVLKVTTEQLKRHGQPPSSGKVISEITFGFWPKVFAKSYQEVWWGPRRQLLTNIIPNCPRLGRDSRGKFEKRLEYFVSLRNRIMHHEAVFEGVGAINRPMLPIDLLHDQIIETIGWINADAATLVTTLDRFNDVFGKSQQIDLEQALKSSFQIT